MRPLILLLVICAVAPLAAQNVVYCPDNQPGVGTCNVFPWGQPNFTYMSRIPASYMDPLNPLIEDVFFAPCNSGTWSAADVQIAIGHVPNPLPTTAAFSFPTISGGIATSLGSFLDMTVLWDSSVGGSFSWPYTAGTWSPLGFGPMGGTGFIWNGIDDVGFYVTMQGATGTSSMHRTSTEPYRLYSSGVYQSPTPTGQGNSGLKISFSLQPGNLPSSSVYGTPCNTTWPALSAPLPPGVGNAAFTFEVTTAVSGAPTFIFSAFASSPGIPLGGGCNLYLEPTSMLLFVNTGFSPFGPVNSVGTTAVHPVPIPGVAALIGQSLYFQAAVIDATNPIGLSTSNGLCLNFN
ncbi:MAG: hypothetical protein CMJ83_10340 [Planctomycetes bacterium]|nr:hypothetical protein [Planctomycetota bacterium]